MYEFPLDKEFIQVIQDYPDNGEELVWRAILCADNDEIFAYLNSKGYSAKAVNGYAEKLKNFAVDELMKLAVVHESLYYPMLFLARTSSSREVFDKAVELSKSPDCEERDLSIILLSEGPGLANFNEAHRELLRILETESDSVVLTSAIYGLNHLSMAEEFDHESESFEHLKHLVDHPSPKVRQAVASTLQGNSDEWVFESLIKLTDDNDPGVRNWAIQSLIYTAEYASEYQNKVSESELMKLPNIFANLLNDSDEEIRVEAISGLALFKDKRACDAIKEELKKPRIKLAVLEAARDLAEPTLYPILRKIRPDQTWDIEALEDAIESCSVKTKKS